MELTWYGAAALVLREGETAIAFDPFCEPALAGEICRTENIFVTHGHFDHIQRIPEIYRDKAKKIRCTGTPRATLIKNGISPEYITEVAPGYQEVVGPFTVTAWQGRHCKFDVKLIFSTVLRCVRHPLSALRVGKALWAYPENGEILFYEIACNGKRLQVMGSLNLAEEEKYPTGADLLVLPYQGRSDLESYALEIVDRLEPKAVVLDHWDDAFPPVSDTVDTRKFEEILQARGIPCRALQKGETRYE